MHQKTHRKSKRSMRILFSLLAAAIIGTASGGLYYIVKIEPPQDSESFLSASIRAVTNFRKNIRSRHFESRNRNENRQTNPTEDNSGTTNTANTAPEPSTPVVSIPTTPTTPIVSTSPTQIVATPESIKALNYKFGVSIGVSLFSVSDTDLGKRLDDMVALGIGWIRFDMDWSDIQRNNDISFDWRRVDRLVNAANVRNIKLLPVLAYTPDWARPAGCTSDKCAPRDPALFAAFAKEAVKRYSSKGIYAWEIWNEPNVAPFWRPVANVMDYATMLKLAHAAIKSQDISALVITGGLAPSDTKSGNISPVDFLKQLYTQDTQSSFEAVGFHPYSFPVLPSYFQVWNAWSQMRDTQTSLRSIMENNGDASKLIWLTEFGAPTGGPGAVATIDNYNLSQHPDHVTEDLQAMMASDAINLAGKSPWAGPLFWHTYKDQGTTSNTIENFFGILRYDGSQKPIYDILKTALLPKAL